MSSLLKNILKNWFMKKKFEPTIDTSLRSIVYVAGPYAGDEKGNTEKASKVGFIATQVGLAAFVPHTCIYSNVYGRDEVPEERQNGIVSTLSIVAHLAEIDGSHLWVIQNEDDSFSSGTEAELLIWKEIKQSLDIEENVTIKKYKDWVKQVD